MIKTYSLKHSFDVGKFLFAYMAILNSIIRDIWDTIEKDKVMKSILRNRYLEGWEYSAHWVDSALKTAYSILGSWRKNYIKGKRKRRRLNIWITKAALSW
jgi:putative transposase